MVIAAIIAGIIGIGLYLLSRSTNVLEDRSNFETRIWHVADGKTGNDVWFYAVTLAASTACIGFAVGVLVANR
jgi:hypothetical protein